MAVNNKSEIKENPIKIHLFEYDGQQIAVYGETEIAAWINLFKYISENIADFMEIRHPSHEISLQYIEEMDLERRIPSKENPVLWWGE